MSAIVRDEPAGFVVGDPPLPPAPGNIIHRCLEKKPDQRFQSAADLAFALRSISNMSGSQMAPVVQEHRAISKSLRLALAVICALALLSGGYWLRRHSVPATLPGFERLTFRQGPVSAARFTSDGQSVLYAAAWDGGTSRTYLVTPGNPESRDLQLPDNSRVLSVSSKGDLALLAGPFGTDGTGTLARNSVSGGQTRELLENVFDADWSPDADAMAVGRRVNTKWRVEYPLGNVLWEGDWPPYGMRISPDGQQVAFCVFSDGSRIGVMTVDRSSRRKFLGTVSGQIATTINARLVWAPDGREIWFRSFDTRDLGTIYAIDLNGKRRVIVHLPGPVTLHDVSRDGRALIATNVTRTGILGLTPGENAERDLSILDASDLKDISRDGRMILATVRGESGGPRGSIYLRPTNGSPPVRVGDGQAYEFSPDGKWLTGYTSNDPATRKFVLLPTGPGEEKQEVIPGLEAGFGIVVGWLPGDQKYLVMGKLPGKHGWQFFAWDAVRAAVQPVSPEGMTDMLPLLSPDGRRFLARGPDQGWQVYPVESGEARRVEGLTVHDVPVGWRADNHSIYMTTRADTNKVLRVSVLDLNTGKRTSWKELRPARPVDAVYNLSITPSGTAYAYNFTEARSDLYVVQNLK